MHRIRLHCQLVGIAATAAIAVAQPPPDSESDAEIIIVDPLPPTERELDDERALSEPGLVTRIRIDDSTRESATLAETLGRVAGAQVRGLGGLGGFASISVRGLGPSQTPVSIDGVPLSRIAGSITDLSRFDLFGLSVIELYRGAVPIELSAAGLGGALNLITALDRRPAISAGVGSYGARHLRARHSGSAGLMRFLVSAGYAGADGDYEFFDDNGTNLDPGDDRIGRRQNNGFDRLDLVVRTSEIGYRRVARGGARLALKRQGLPGLAGNQTQRAGLDSASGVLDAAVETLWGNSGVGRVAGFAMFDRFHLRDPDGEVGLGSDDTIGESISVGVGAAASARGWRVPTATASIDVRADGFGERNRLTGMAGARGVRLGAALGGQARIRLGETAALVGSLRVEVLETRPRGGSMAIDGRTDIDPSPRLAALWRPAPDVSLKASAGYAIRQPNLVELFGDRGYAAGNPELRSERGPSADAGVVWLPSEPPLGLSRMFAELAGFWSRPDDAIVYFPTAGQVARPFNVGAARIAGLEASVQASRRNLSGIASYTFTDARDRDSGNRLPNRARHRAYARVDVRWWRLSTYADASYTGGNAVDRANAIELPRRLFVGAGLAATLSDRLSLSVEGKNLGDEIVEQVELEPPPRPDLTSSPRAVSDFFGYPLPGRALYVSARLTF